MIHSCPKTPAAQDEKRIDDPSLLLRTAGGTHAALFDGAGPDSWGDGGWLYCHDPVATLEVFACGWGRWRDAGGTRWLRGEPLRLWSRFLDDAPAVLSPDADRDAARFVTALGYDLAWWIERLPRRHDWCDEPVLFCALYESHQSGEYPEDEKSGAGRWCGESIAERWRGEADAGRRCDEPDVERRSGEPDAERSFGEPDAERWCGEPIVERRSGGVAPLNHRLTDATPAGVEWGGLTALDEYREYAQRVERILEYIAAGDVYQVNLARAFSAQIMPARAPELMDVLRRDYPMPYAAFVDLGELVLVSNSPECFLRIRGREVSTFPIKGTRRTDNVSGADSSHSSHSSHSTVPSDLTADPKERAEHVMIVDLERNDLGRVCETGSVEVRDLAGARSFPLLTHMVSEVRGRLRAEVRLPDVIRATFPGGSITGAPKVRAMQIIEELEARPRGFYTGAIGWSDLAGNACFNIAIRTARIGHDGLRYHAGGGIVADSDPAREFEETLVKTEALRRVVEGVSSGRVARPDRDTRYR